MRVSRDQAAANREKILDIAAKMFREKGFDGIGVADLMKAVGLTHGGFYGHFDSKEDLMAQACERAVDDLLAAGEARRADEHGNPVQLFIAHYLSTNHRDSPGSGCLMAALGADAARQTPKVRGAFTRAAARLHGGLSRLIGGDETKAREKSLLTLASLVGAQVIARAVDDDQFSREVLRIVREHASGLYSEEC